jgi:hypothetical protein
MRILPSLLIAAALVFSFYLNAQATLITFEFQGGMKSTDQDFSIGDSFSGSYTFESTTPGIDHPDASLNLQYGNSITAWDITFVGTGYRFMGTGSTISVGNSTVVGDRYIVTLTAPISVGVPLPSGRTLNFIQFDLFDPYSTGADLLTDDSIQTISPNPTLAASSGGRLLFNNGNQPQLGLNTLTSPPSSVPGSPVPEPGTWLLMGTGLVGLLGYGWWRKA